MESFHKEKRSKENLLSGKGKLAMYLLIFPFRVFGHLLILS